MLELDWENGLKISLAKDHIAGWFSESSDPNAATIVILKSSERIRLAQTTYAAMKTAYGV